MTSAEVKLANDIALYIDQKPDEQAMKFCEYAINSESVVLRGLAVMILSKHFGDSYHSAFLKNYTVNPKTTILPRIKGNSQNRKLEKVA